MTALAVTSTQEHVVTASKDGQIKVQSVLGSQGGWTAHVAGAVTCIAVPAHNADRLEEFVVGYSPGTFSLLRKVCAHTREADAHKHWYGEIPETCISLCHSPRTQAPRPIHHTQTRLQTWLGASEMVIHRHDGPVHDTLWLEHAIIWATDVGISACLPGGRGVAPQLRKPPQAGLRSCSLAPVTSEAALAAWPHAVQLFAVRQGRQRLTGLALVRLHPLRSFTVPYRLHGIAPFGLHLAVLADVSPGACRPAPLSTSNSRSAAAITDPDTPAAPRDPAPSDQEGSPPAADAPPGGADSGPTDAPEASGDEEQTPGPTDAAGGALSRTSSPPQTPPAGESDGGGGEGHSGTGAGGLWAISADPRAAVALSGPSTPHLQLRVVSLAGEELLQDDLDVELEADAAGVPGLPLPRTARRRSLLAPPECGPCWAGRHAAVRVASGATCVGGHRYGAQGRVCGAACAALPRVGEPGAGTRGAGGLGLGPPYAVHTPTAPVAAPPSRRLRWPVLTSRWGQSPLTLRATCRGRGGLCAHLLVSHSVRPSPTPLPPCAAAVQPPFLSAHDRHRRERRRERSRHAPRC